MSKKISFSDGRGTNSLDVDYIHAYVADGSRIKGRITIAVCHAQARLGMANNELGCAVAYWRKGGSNQYNRKIGREISTGRLTYGISHSSDRTMFYVKKGQYFDPIDIVAKLEDILYSVKNGSGNVFFVPDWIKKLQDLRVVLPIKREYYRQDMFDNTDFASDDSSGVTSAVD